MSGHGKIGKVRSLGTHQWQVHPQTRHCRHPLVCQLCAQAPPGPGRSGASARPACAPPVQARCNGQQACESCRKACARRALPGKGKHGSLRCLDRQRLPVHTHAMCMQAAWLERNHCHTIWHTLRHAHLHNAPQSGATIWQMSLCKPHHASRKPHCASCKPHRAANSQRGRIFAGHHAEWEIPGGDGGTDTNRLLQYDHARIWFHCLQHISIHPSALLCKPLYRASAAAQRPYEKAAQGTAEGFSRPDVPASLQADQVTISLCKVYN